MMGSAENNPRRAGTIWMLNLDEEVPAITPLIPATFRRVGPDLLPALASSVSGVSSEELLKRFETGRRCYAAWVGDQVAAYGWVSLNEEHIGELNLQIKLLPGEAYIWDCATAPEFRRNHLYSALLGYIVKELRSEGLCRAWIGADIDNIPSQQGIARAGFHHVADLVVARLLAMRQIWAKGKPGVPEAIVAEARRVFLNDRDKIWRAITSSAIEG
jgi:ribosomal protein S18 acetylase RimI-like enzyme